MTMKYVLACAALVACAAPEDLEELDPDPSGTAQAPVLDGPAGQWTWFDIPGAVCGYGQQTGIGVSVGTSEEVMIYLEGGGLCWDELTCAASLPPLPPLIDRTIVLASYFTNGFTKQTFETILAGGGYASGIFDRNLANNPYKDATQIYVPYCTGDVHTGNTQRYFPHVKKLAHWQGRQNLDLALAAITQSFPATSRVTLAGTSAGAYGATLAFARVQAAFGGTRVDLVADSGPLLAFSPFLQQGYPVWGTDAIIPPGLASYPHLYAHYAGAYPASRFAVLTHDQDLVIAAGHLEVPFPTFYFTMKRFTEHRLGPLANWRSFVAAGTAHGTLYDIRESTDGTVLADWLTQMHDDDAAWASKTSIVW